jgi:putative transposase
MGKALLSNRDYIPLGILVGRWERKAPKHALAEIRDDFHRTVCAANADTAHTAHATFERAWAKRCPGVLTSLREGGDELLTFFSFPKAQWKTLRTTNVIERLHEESAAA